MLNRHGEEGLFQEVGFELKPERGHGFKHMEKLRVSEAEEALSANAPTVGKSFSGIFLGRKDDRVTEAQWSGERAAGDRMEH